MGGSEPKNILGEVWIFSGSTQSNLATEFIIMKEALLLVLYTEQNCFKVKLASPWKLTREIIKFKTKNTASKYQNENAELKGNMHNSLEEKVYCYP